MPHNSKTRLVVVATSSAFARVFLQDQLSFMAEQGYEIFLICGPDIGFAELQHAMPGRVVSISFSRRIHPIRDVLALLRLVQELLRINPQIVHTHTPKAGIVGMAAAWLCGIPNRVHTIHGLRSETLFGLKGVVVSATEQITVRLASRVLAVSQSLRDEVIHRGIGKPEKIAVLGKGACAGVNRSVFNLEGAEKRRASFRAQHNIPPQHLVVTYIGRIAEDKGLATLIKAWLQVRGKEPRLHLVVSGPIDHTDPVSPSHLQVLRDDDRVIYLPGFTSEGAKILAASDIAVQPSYREGLGVAALEASAMGLPIIATRVTGLIDAVEDGRTGILVSPADADELAMAIERLLEDKVTREVMGRDGQQFVATNFDHRQVRLRLLEFYRQLPKKKSRFKRILDIIMASIGGLMLLPLMVLAALAIWSRMGKPIFFRQQRAGRDGKLFDLLKFRTMQVDSLSSNTASDALRLTSLGRWLRKLSIDELPQLWNVLKGDMSLVGPRPLLAEYLPRYSTLQLRRHEVAPGLTGWAQVKGRNSLSWEEKFELDVWYVDHQSLLLDVKILFLTVKRVCTMSDINPNGMESMQEFLGTSHTSV